MRCRNKKMTRLKQTEHQRIEFHIESLSEEIEELNERIRFLIQSNVAKNEEEAYAKIRRLQLVREIMREQLSTLHEVYDKAR